MQSLLFNFQGRVNRAKWWLINVAVVIAEGIAFGIIGAAFGGAMDPATGLPELSAIGYILVLIVIVVVVWISLAVAVKRWHDRGKSGWWILIVLVPVVGSLWYLIECGFLPGTRGSNRFGADPLGSV
jgi:uncharacterized membrane protein YhaH (DUF805 family)